MKDTNHGVLKEYVVRLKKEAVLKALLCALSVSFGVLLVTSLICWFTEFGGYWIYPVAFAVPFGAAMPLFYFFVFYPSEKYVAKRLDKLGLDERIMTMVEFENQDSYIMQRQRQDAVNALSKLNSRLVKFALSAALIAIPAVAIPTATAMTTVDALSKAEVISSGKDLIDELKRDKTTFELVYRVPDDLKGIVLLYSASCPEGADEITVTVGRGQEGEVVKAFAYGVPADDYQYVYVRWADGVDDFLRQDASVQGKIIVTPIFEDLGYEVGDDFAEDYEGPDRIGSGDGDSADRNPANNDPDDNRKPWEPPKDSGAGGGDDTTQYVIDGKTDYSGAPYEEAYEKAMEELGQSGGADSEYKGVASDYFEGIKKKDNNRN